MTTTLKFRRRRDYIQENLYNYDDNDSNDSFRASITVEDLNSNNTFIDYLIKKRLASNSTGFSSHIAAFISKIGSKQQCLLRRKGKHRDRRKF